MTQIQARPRVLYYSLFSWMAITGGRFLAPFLEHEANMSDANIGLTLSAQYAILSVFAPYYGRLADSQERKYPHYGRGRVLIAGITFGTIAFHLHGVNFVWDLPIFHSLYYHFVVQILYALNFAIMFPVLDGMTLDYLQRENGDAMDYGKERLHGAISWGVTNMLLGPLIDRFGFPVYYPCCLFSAIYSIGSILFYSRAQARDSTRSSTGEPGSSDINSKNPSEETRMKEAPSSLRLILGIFGSIYGAAFVLCYFLMTTGFSVVENLVFLFFEFLGGSNTICAITVVLTVIFEIPIFQIAPSLLRKHGVGGCSC
jgi:Na+/melibiose symporter-like transporter